MKESNRRRMWTLPLRKSLRQKKSRPYFGIRLPNLRARSGEVCVYKQVASYLSRPKTRNKCRNISQPLTAVCNFIWDQRVSPQITLLSDRSKFRAPIDAAAAVSAFERQQIRHRVCARLVTYQVKK